MQKELKMGPLFGYSLCKYFLGSPRQSPVPAAVFAPLCVSACLMIAASLYRVLEIDSRVEDVARALLS